VRDSIKCLGKISVYITSTFSPESKCAVQSSIIFKEVTMSPVTKKNSASAINPVIFYMLCLVLLRFQNVSCRSVSVGFAEKTPVFGSV